LVSDQARLDFFTVRDDARDPRDCRRDPVSPLSQVAGRIAGLFNGQRPKPATGRHVQTASHGAGKIRALAPRFSFSASAAPLALPSRSTKRPRAAK